MHISHEYISKLANCTESAIKLQSVSHQPANLLKYVSKQVSKRIGIAPLGIRQRHSTYTVPRTALTQCRELQLQRRCASQTEPAYSQGRSPSPHSRTLVCSHM